jgi:hypothetical protein
VKNTTAPYKYPRIIEYVEELPKTISGKILRRELRERPSGFIAPRGRQASQKAKKRRGRQGYPLPRALRWAGLSRA